MGSSFVYHLRFHSKQAARPTHRLALPFVSAEVRADMTYEGELLPNSPAQPKGDGNSHAIQCIEPQQKEILRYVAHNHVRLPCQAQPPNAGVESVPVKRLSAG